MQTAEARLDRLYRLLPAIHQIRDHERGQPLRALLQVVAEQVNLIEDDIAAMYDSWFVETCSDWVVPYLGDLIGYTPVPEAGLPGNPAVARDRARNRVLLPRREVANTLRYRRRKGTLALLELLARDVAGWPARAVESSEPPSKQPPSGSAPSLKFGVYVHLKVWRLNAYPVTRAPAMLVESEGPHCFTFSPLGNDAPLFNRPRAPGDDTAVADDDTALPLEIGLDRFSRPIEVDGVRVVRASPDYYGLRVEGGATVAQSVAIWARGWPPDEAESDDPVPYTRIVPVDLGRWDNPPDNGLVAVDPVRGRIMFPPQQRPRKGVFVSYNHGFSAELGGGEYERPLLQRAGAVLIRVEGVDAFLEALEPWIRRFSNAADCDADQPEHAVIEIADSGDYAVRIDLLIGAGHSLQIRAAQHRRPVLRLLDWQSSGSDALAVTGLEGSRFTLDGLLVSGRGVRIEGALRSFTVRHATLVPGWTLEPDCAPQRPLQPSIELVDTLACLVIENSIAGSIQVNNGEVAGEPVRIRIADSVIDSAGADDDPRSEAIGARGPRIAHAILHVVRSTLVGSVMTHAIELAENSIFMGRVTAARRQTGCVRFCYVPEGSRTPRRFNCQPDFAGAAAMKELGTAATKGEVDAALATARSRVRPRFNSLRYGTSTYIQLAGDCAPEIVRGADDESELGVFHDLFQPQRLANLQTRVEEFVPVAVDAEVIVVS